MNVFRERVKPHGVGERVRLLVARDVLTLDGSVGAERLGPKTDSGVAWNGILPDLRALIEKNPGKVVTVSAERARWTREIAITLVERPGTRATPLPDNRTLRPDLEAEELAPEAVLARTLIARAGLDAQYADLKNRLEEDERVEDPFRLRTVRYLKREPLRLPQATRQLGRELARSARGDLRAFCNTSLHYLDADLAPILTTSAPQAPPVHSSVEAHVNYCLALMRRARDLVSVALRGLTSEEQDTLERELPSVAAKFKDTVYLHEDEDPARWKRHSAAIDLLAKVDRGAFVQGLRELAPLATPAYLDRLEADLKEAEGRSKGDYTDNNQGANGWVLYQAETELGPVVVGGSGPNAYRGDFALIIDLGGDDRYYRTAGGAHGRARPVAVSLDLAGDDRYQSTEPFSQGAALMGVGLLVDRRGNDHYTSMESFAQGAALCGAAALVDLAGDDEYRGDAYAQGASLCSRHRRVARRRGPRPLRGGSLQPGFRRSRQLRGARRRRGRRPLRRDSAARSAATAKTACYEAARRGARGASGARPRGDRGARRLRRRRSSTRRATSPRDAATTTAGARSATSAAATTATSARATPRPSPRTRRSAACGTTAATTITRLGRRRPELRVGPLGHGLHGRVGGNDRYEGGFFLSQGAAAHNGFALFSDASGEDSYRIERRDRPRRRDPTTITAARRSRSSSTRAASPTSIPSAARRRVRALEGRRALGRVRGLRRLAHRDLGSHLGGARSAVAASGGQVRVELRALLSSPRIPWRPEFRELF